MDLTILTCNYNTPTLTLNMLKSLKLVSNKKPEILVVNTSSQIQSDDVFIENKIPFVNLINGTHGEGVNLGLTKIKTKYCLLVDTDILFLQDFEKPFNIFKEKKLTLMGKVVGDCGGKKLYPRVEPWFCFINVEDLKNNNIQFFDSIRSRKNNSSERVYDVGSTMFEDVVSNNLFIGDVDMTDKYFKHYGGMSWREQKFNPYNIDTDIDFGGTHPDFGIYSLALKIKQQYLQDTKYLESVEL